MQLRDKSPVKWLTKTFLTLGLVGFLWVPNTSNAFTLLELCNMFPAHPLCQNQPPSSVPLQPTPKYESNYPFELPSGLAADIHFDGVADALKNWSSDTSTSFCDDAHVAQHAAFDGFPVLNSCNNYKNPMFSGDGPNGTLPSEAGLIAPHQMIPAPTMYWPFCKLKMNVFDPMNPQALAMGWDFTQEHFFTYAGCGGMYEPAVVPGVLQDESNRIANRAYLTDSVLEMRQDGDENVLPFALGTAMDPVNLAFEFDSVALDNDDNRLPISITKGPFYPNSMKTNIIGKIGTTLFKGVTQSLSSTGASLFYHDFFHGNDLAILKRKPDGSGSTGEVTFIENRGGQAGLQCTKDAFAANCPACTDPTDNSTWATNDFATDCAPCFSVPAIADDMNACEKTIEYTDDHVGPTFALEGTSNPVFIAVRPTVLGGWFDPGPGAGTGGGGDNTGAGTYTINPNFVDDYEYSPGGANQIDTTGFGKFDGTVRRTFDGNTNNGEDVEDAEAGPSGEDEVEADVPAPGAIRQFRGTSFLENATEALKQLAAEGMTQEAHAANVPGNLNWGIKELKTTTLVVANRGDPIDCFSNDIHFRNPTRNNATGMITDTNAPAGIDMGDTEGVPMYSGGGAASYMPGTPQAGKCGYLTFYRVGYDGGTGEPTVKPIMSSAYPDEVFKLPVHVNPTSFVFGDYNVDGMIDILVASTGSQDSNVNGALSAVFCAAPPTKDYATQADPNPLCPRGALIVDDTPIDGTNTPSLHPWWLSRSTFRGYEITKADLGTNGAVVPGETGEGGGDISNCLDGVDNEGNPDGLIDCRDDECSNKSVCLNPKRPIRAPSDAVFTSIDSYQAANGDFTVALNALQGADGTDPITQPFYYYNVDFDLVSYDTKPHAGTLKELAKPIKKLALNWSPYPLGVFSGLLANQVYQKGLMGIENLTSLLYSYILPGWILKYNLGGNNVSIPLRSFCADIGIGMNNTSNYAPWLQEQPVPPAIGAGGAMGPGGNNFLQNMARCDGNFRMGPVSNAITPVYWEAWDEAAQTGQWGPKFSMAYLANSQTERAYKDDAAEMLNYDGAGGGWIVSLQFDFTVDYGMISGPPIKLPEVQVDGDGSAGYFLPNDQCDADRFEISTLVMDTVEPPNSEPWDLTDAFRISVKDDPTTPHRCLQNYPPSDMAGRACCFMLLDPGVGPGWLDELSVGDLYPNQACPGKSPMDCCREQLTNQFPGWSFGNVTTDLSKPWTVIGANYQGEEGCEDPDECDPMFEMIFGTDCCDTHWNPADPAGSVAAAQADPECNGETDPCLDPGGNPLPPPYDECCETGNWDECDDDDCDALPEPWKSCCESGNWDECLPDDDDPTCVDHEGNPLPEPYLSCCENNDWAPCLPDDGGTPGGGSTGGGDDEPDCNIVVNNSTINCSNLCCNCIGSGDNCEAWCDVDCNDDDLDCAMLIAAGFTPLECMDLCEENPDLPECQEITKQQEAVQACTDAEGNSALVLTDCSGNPREYCPGLSKPGECCLELDPTQISYEDPSTGKTVLLSKSSSTGNIVADFEQTKGISLREMKLEGSDAAYSLKGQTFDVTSPIKLMSVPVAGSEPFKLEIGTGVPFGSKTGDSPTEVSVTFMSDDGVSKFADCTAAFNQSLKLGGSGGGGAGSEGCGCRLPGVDQNPRQAIWTLAWMAAILMMPKLMLLRRRKTVKITRS